MKNGIFAVLLAALIAPAGWAAFTPSTNGNGVSWVSASAESWSGSAQTRASDGAVLHLAGAFDTSVDTMNGAGVTGYLGLLDPILAIADDTPTPTETVTFTPGGPTLTFTPTITPGGPTLTPTTCMGALADADFNLDGVNGIDSRDLLLLYAALKEGTGNPYDFDCDDMTDILDLIRFSQRWKIANP